MSPSSPSAFEKAAGYITASQHAPRPRGPGQSPPLVTLSRQTGARGRSIGLKLEEYLREHDADSPRPWTLFDKTLVRQVLEDHNLPARLEEYMPEDASNELESTLGEIVGLHPNHWTLFEKTAQTILRLASLGNVILVGRGGNLLTAHFPHAVHVRLIGSLEKRAARVQEVYDLPPGKALAFLEREDHARRRYLKKHFGENIDDARHYTLVLNTDRVSDAHAVELLAHLVLARSPRPVG